MSIVYGTFVFDDATFNAEYRYGNTDKPLNQRGYAKCLIINRGTKASGELTDGHSYFGDDKYEVKSAEFSSDTIVLNLEVSLSNPENIWKREKTVTLKITK